MLKTRHLRAALALGALAALTLRPLAGQEAAEICKAVSKLAVGQWASYDANCPRCGDAKLRLAVVGSEPRGDSTLYWLEINGNDMGPQGQGGIIQLLVAGFGTGSAGVRGVVMKTGDQPAMRLPDPVVGMMGQRVAERSPGFELSRRCLNARAVGWETVTVSAGAIRALHVKDADGGEAWLSRDIPFGFVKAVGTDGTEILLTGHGTDAKSSITEKPQEMPLTGKLLQKP